MIKKSTVLCLLSLFIWNVALSGVPSFLVCLHQDFMLHVQPETEVDGHCEGTHEHAHDAATMEAACEIDDDCTDLELSGTDLIPTRLNESETFQVPAVTFAALEIEPLAPRIFFQPAMTQLRLRAPPSIHWLTDLYIQKTVLRV
ncbi:MAG: hypothetical protein ABF330_04490 [Lentimonas sp.]